jgi:hypothetical protein
MNKLTTIVIEVVFVICIHLSDRELVNLKDPMLPRILT